MPAITPDMFDHDPDAVGPGRGRLIAVDAEAGVGVSVIGNQVNMFAAQDAAGVDVTLSARITPEALRYVADWMEAQS